MKRNNLIIKRSDWLNAKTLLEWEQKHDAKNQTMKGFGESFSKWREEDRWEELYEIYLPLLWI
ncbi:hypothetical protein ABE61_02465 [Lysinibacillus sphaericus]|nr:hypothetical protein [Lysinibacillus sphaericus]MBG9480147.1 hypothetical protein [Lysinibacillus sphaericus]MBG9593999.1 hypothetical protein [Lysinibacillus sphaericus]